MVHVQYVLTVTSQYDTVLLCGLNFGPAWVVDNCTTPTMNIAMYLTAEQMMVRSSLNSTQLYVVSLCMADLESLRQTRESHPRWFRVSFLINQSNTQVTARYLVSPWLPCNLLCKFSLGLIPIQGDPWLLGRTLVEVLQIGRVASAKTQPFSQLRDMLRYWRLGWSAATDRWWLLMSVDAWLRDG